MGRMFSFAAAFKCRMCTVYYTYVLNLMYKYTYTYSNCSQLWETGYSFSGVITIFGRRSAVTQAAHKLLTSLSAFVFFYFYQVSMSLNIILSVAVSWNVHEKF